MVEIARLVLAFSATVDIVNPEFSSFSIPIILPAPISFYQCKYMLFYRVFFFMVPKVNANNFLHNWNIFILLFATSSVKYAILSGIKTIILPCFLKTQSSFFQLLSFSPHKHDIKKNTE